MQPEIKNVNCPNCSSKHIKKAGIKRNKLQILQKYFCIACKKTFTLQPQKYKTYSINTLLKAVSLYNLGLTQTQISKKLSPNPSQKTISNWMNEYRKICTFARLRANAIKQFSPKEIIKKQTLSHIQPCTFKYHQAKLNLLIKENPQFAKLKDYMQEINTKDFPHHIFTYN